ncbi:MAG TPA: nucleotidyltransferase domain-containing protein [Propionibacteriaceae bacterium]|nr:nucleotidyltransferase domain-containing protein [Propionibacteriaceae bacterium]
MNSSSVSQVEIGMFPEVERYLGELVDAARGTLGANLVGAYAAGSVALGAYQPGRSDVDVALVCEHTVDLPLKRALVSRLRHEALPCPARGLELVLYRRAVAQSGTIEPGFDVELNSGAGMTFRATYAAEDRPAADGRFWYALDRSILHQSGYALWGPPAPQMFADLSPADVPALLVDALRWWLDLPTPPGDEPAPGTDDAVLGACRSLVRYRHGVWLSKGAAGRRLRDTGIAAELIDRCLQARHGGPPPRPSEARAFQNQVLDEILAELCSGAP